MLDHSDSSSSAVLVNSEASGIDFELENSFSLISEFIDDDFSFISSCGSTGDIELTPAMKCYKHSRNTKLNKKLDLAVILSVALVTGLGIGNFIGRRNSCSQLCANNFHCFADVDPLMQIMPEKEAHSILDSKGTYSVDSVKTSVSDVKTSNLSSSKGSSNLTIFGDSVVDNKLLLSVEISNNTVAFVPQEHQGLIFNDDGPLLTSDDFFHEFELLVPLSNNLVRYPEIHLSKMEHVTYSDVLNGLNNDIKDVIHGIESLVSVALHKENINDNDATCLNKMFHLFCSSVEQKTEELSTLVSTFAFKNPVNGKKQFLKMSHIIMKSVDKLLKNNFIILKQTFDKSINYPLKSMCDIGLHVIDRLEKKWNAEKHKLVFHQEKREKRNHFENKKRQSKYSKTEKSRHEKKNTAYYKSKQNHHKPHVKPNRQAIYKKQY